MANKFRGFFGIGLSLLLTASSLPAIAQQPQARTPAETDRALIERERATQDARASTPAPTMERIYFERDAMQGPPPGDFIFMATEMSFGGPLVKNAPYSAQAVTESTQTLSDGNRIVNKTMASIYRDSEGRTRREQTLKAIGPFANGGEAAQTVFINDPVAGTSFTLDARTQTARRMPPMRFKVSSPKAGEAQSPETMIRINPNGAKTPAPEGSKQYRIAADPDVMIERRHTEAGVAMGWLDARNPTARTEALGKQNVEGVEAEGTRSTVTIPAGEIGNERAIEIVSERWFSRELQAIVMTRHTDPRFGENSYRLTNIIRTEPARELFEVPPGYTMKEVPTVMGGTPAAPLSGGVLNGKAINLPLPVYPAIAKQAGASGSVTVTITIDEEGNVIAARAVSGHPLLQGSSVAAAQQAKFSPTRLEGKAVKVSGVLVYTFAAQ